MTYLLAVPDGSTIPWKVDKAVLLQSLKDGMALYCCWGDDPPTGATGCMIEERRFWWPVFQGPPGPARGLLVDSCGPAGPKEQAT